jgi:steroid delta-isomerase-like uncharacterized protein
MEKQPAAALVLELLEAVWNRGDTAVVDRLVAADYIEHGTDGPEIGRQHVSQDAETYRSAFPDLRMIFDEPIAEGDRVATRFTAMGTQLAPMAGLPATGKSARVSGIWIHRVVDGRITESWVTWDNLGLLRQLGFVQPERLESATAVVK